MDLADFFRKSLILSDMGFYTKGENNPFLAMYKKDISLDQADINGDLDGLEEGTGKDKSFFNAEDSFNEYLKKVGPTLEKTDQTGIMDLLQLKEQTDAKLSGEGGLSDSFTSNLKSIKNNSQGSSFKYGGVSFNLNRNSSNHYFSRGGTKQELPYQTYERITGKPWVTAHEEGLTSGSSLDNLKLQKRLVEESEASKTPTDKDFDRTGYKVEVPNTEGQVQKTFEDILIGGKRENGNFDRTGYKVEVPNEETSQTTPPSSEGVRNNQSQKNYLEDIYNNSNALPEARYEGIKKKLKPVIIPGNPVSTFVDEKGSPITNYATEHLGEGRTRKIVNPAEEEGFFKGIGNEIVNFSKDVYNTTKDTIDQAGNYISRHFFDEGVDVKDSLIPAKKGSTQKVKQESVPALDENIQEVDLQQARKYVRGIVNLSKNKFESRNRGDFTPVVGGDSALVTTFYPFKDTMETDHQNFIHLSPEGDFNIIKKTDKVKGGKFSPIEELPLDKMQFSKDGKQVRLRDTEDFKGKVIYLEGDQSQKKFNSGIGVGKKFGDWAPVDQLNNFSFLNGAKVMLKVNNETFLVSGTGKDIIEAYRKASEKGKVQAFKLDNGSFNLPMKGQASGVYSSEDLKAHQNRNNQGGNSLVIKY